MICTRNSYSFGLGPAQDDPYALIFWYVSKIIYLILNKELEFIFDLIALIVRAFIVLGNPRTF